MAGILFLVFLVLTSKRLSADGAESLPSFDSSPVELMANKNCSAPEPVVSGSTLKWRSGVYNQSVFLPGEKAEFVCKEGFRQIGWLQTLACQANGTWSSSSSDFEEDFKASESVFGYCITKNCSDSETFNCASRNESVPICKKCDCIADCRDGSDENACGSILINVTGRATGEINSPNNKIDYTGPLKCRRTLWTDDAGFYIKLLFTNFSMSGDCSDNYVFLENATFSDTDTSPKCCKETKNIPCAFGGKTGPPLLHTDKNFMIVNFVSKDSKSSSFSAKWYNVNGFYPYGLIPKDDSDYPDRIKFGSSSSQSTDDESTDPTYIAATVIFSIVAFVVLAVVACKIGQHFLGPRCSLGHCCAWIAARRSQRSPRLSPRREPSPEARPIRGDIYNEPTQRGAQRTVQVDARAPSTLRTRYGSAENA